MNRAILHVDMDAFYAAVEQRDRPELRGQPVIVGGIGARGVVSTASYEARVFGVRSAMPMSEARRRCPNGVYLAPRMTVYKEASEQVFEILKRFTPLVQGLSLDEAFLDVTASQSIFGSAIKIAREIKQQIRSKTLLTASIGIAPNKLVAKIASDLRKPDGLVIVEADEVQATLDPLPINKLFGVGPKTGARLRAQGIQTFHDLRLASDAQLQPIFGRDAPLIRQRAAGIDNRPVLAEWDEKQISTETTFDVDIDNVHQLRTELVQLADRTASRLRAKQFSAHGIAVKIRRQDFHTFTRQRHCEPATNDSRVIAELAQRLLNDWLSEHPGAAVRLLGVGAYDLGPVAQLSLFDSPAAANDSRQNVSQLDVAVDRIRGKFGATSLVRGSTLRNTAPAHE
ncbi:MAG TPA: DNA polymerase IV [Steroidobacteraceae bacterium]|nr:DNA polymerase IV [Steroidobacteraceae bacterium]